MSIVFPPTVPLKQPIILQAGDTAKADTIVGEALAEAAGNLSQLISVHEVKSYA